MAERTRGPDRTVGNSATTLNGQAGGNSVTNTQLESPVPTLANQNKKKGSLKELQNIQGTKTIFGIDAQASSTPLKDLKSSTAKSTPNPTPSRSSTWAQSRVIPPSELEVLPSNVFVTHVEYQRNGWTPRQRNQRGVQKALIDTSTVVDVDAGVDETEDMDEEAFLNDSMAVNEAETNHVQLLEDAQTSDDVNEDIWTVAESRFDTLPPLKAGSMPCEGTVLAWKVCGRTNQVSSVYRVLTRTGTLVGSIHLLASARHTAGYLEKCQIGDSAGAAIATGGGGGGSAECAGPGSRC